MNQTTLTPPGRDTFKSASSAAPESLANARSLHCGEHELRGPGGEHLKIFANDANNRPVAWLVNNRGARFSEIYRGATIDETIQNLYNGLDYDKTYNAHA